MDNPLLKFVLVFFAALYIVGPVIIRFTFFQNANPSFEPCPGPLPQPRFNYLTGLAETLARDGFELVGYFQQIGQTKNVNLYLALLVQRASGDMALAIQAETVKGTASITRKILEFATRFSDGSSQTTGNSSHASLFVRPPEKPVVHFPEVSDPRRLYALHRKLIHRFRPGAKTDLPPRGMEIARIAESMQREMMDQVAPGYLWLDPAAGLYRPTWKGAILFTWKSALPVKQIRQAWMSQKNARLRRSLEADSTPIY